MSDYPRFDIAIYALGVLALGTVAWDIGLWLRPAPKEAQLTLTAGWHRGRADHVLDDFHDTDDTILFCDGSVVIVGEKSEAQAMQDLLRKMRPSDFNEQCARPL